MTQRTPLPTDFTVEVESVGVFRFAKRAMRDEMRIAAEYSRLTEGVDTPTIWLETVATWISTLKVLIVTAPPGWEDMDALDPLDEDTYSRLMRVHRALREKEGSFRRPAASDGQGARPGDGADGGLRVAPQVPSSPN